MNIQQLNKDLASTIILVILSDQKIHVSSRIKMYRLKHGVCPQASRSTMDGLKSLATYVPYNRPNG